MPIDVKAYYSKLARNESLTEAEVIALLKDYETVQTLAAHLASCQAATLEGLPKSTSKSQRSRHASICKTAANALNGNLSGIRYPTTVEAARDRCFNAVSDAEQLLGGQITAA